MAGSKERQDEPAERLEGAAADTAPAAEGGAGDPEGGAEPAEGRRRDGRRRKSSLRRRVRAFLGRVLVSAAAAIVPYVYRFYMELVWRTSRVTVVGMEKMQGARLREERVLSALWHQDVFFVGYAYRPLEASTLASVGDWGEIITAILKACHYEVFRGGTSLGTARKKEVLPTLIGHMRRNRYVQYGITTDGSFGPARYLKSGVIAIARVTGAPIYTIRCRSHPCLEAPTWDRTTIPLPFTHVAIIAEGPFYCPRGTKDEAFEAVRQRVERSLDDTTDRVEHLLETGELLPPRVLPDGPYVEPVVRRGVRAHWVGPRLRARPLSPEDGRASERRASSP